MQIKANFSSKRVGSLTCKKGVRQSIYWDGKTPGLGLRVTQTGAKSYVFEGRLRRKTLRMTIGDIKTWTIGKAQAEATRLKALTDQGIDPRLMKTEQLAKAEAAHATAKALDVRKRLEVSTAWRNYVAARSPDWGELHRRSHNRMVQTEGEPRNPQGRRPGQPKTTVAGPLAPLMTLKLEALNSDVVQAWLRKEKASRPTQAALAFRMLRAFIAWCAEHKEYGAVVNTNACTEQKVRLLVPRTNSRKDCLEKEQLGPWFTAVQQTCNPSVAAYLQCLLLSGARSQELLGLQWADVDFRWQRLSIRDKVEKRRAIPLTPYMAFLMSSLPRRNEWVFASPAGGTGKLSSPHHAHNAAVAVAGLPRLSMHGLRRSFSTLSEWCEVPAGVVAQIMGHKPSATAEKHYKPRPLDLLRMWHERIETFILECAKVDYKAAENVSGLRVVSAA